MRHSTIFKSRWMALLWAAGILWFAYDVATPDSDSSGNAAAAQVTDATGAPVTNEDEQRLAAALEQL